MIPARVSVDAVRQRIGAYADTVQTAEARYEKYKELIGFLPPRIAARRAGATWEEMQAVVSLAFLFRGLPAANRGAELLANMAKREVE